MFKSRKILIDEDFNYRWKEGTIRGWEKKEETKEDIHNNPLYCNACAKLFSNENTYIVRKLLIFILKFFSRTTFQEKNTKIMKKFIQNNRLKILRKMRKIE